MKAEKRTEKGKKIQNTKNKKKTKKKLIYDSEDDWTCKGCGSRYSSELIIGGTTSRRWIKCDICKSAYHYKCIPKAHLNVYGIEDTDEDDDEIAFVCHICSPDTDDDMLVDEDESDQFSSAIITFFMQLSCIYLIAQAIQPIRDIFQA